MKGAIVPPSCQMGGVREFIEGQLLQIVGILGRDPGSQHGGQYENAQDDAARDGGWIVQIAVVEKFRFYASVIHSGFSG